MFEVKNKEKHNKVLPMFSAKDGLSVIWRLLSYGLAIDLFCALVFVPLYFILLIFAPDMIPDSLALLK